MGVQFDLRMACESNAEYWGTQVAPKGKSQLRAASQKI